MKGLGCRRFGRLLNELADREATTRETSFLARHRAACGACRREEEAASFSLDLLRGGAFEAQVEDSFDRRVIRRVRVQKVQDGFRYWSPAFVGGLVAAGLLLATVQALTKPIDPTATTGVSASRGAKSSLALKDVPTLTNRAVR